MDVTLFTASSPGRLEPIESGDHAFVPNELPPSWEFPPRLWPLLAEAKQQLGILEGIGRNLPNPAILLRPLEDQEAIRSSRLEGTYATPTELLLFEIEPRESRSKDDPANDWREVFNYRKALHAGAASELPISLRLIKDLHRQLLMGVRGADRGPGEFRQTQVYLGVTKRFIPPPPFRLAACLDRLEKYIHRQPRTYDPIVECFLVHYQFETIHPFIDGNGRVGRLLLALMFQQLCGLTKPWLYMSAYFEEHKDEYINNLFSISTMGNWADWIEFCLKGTVSQANDAILRCDRLLRIKTNFAEQMKQIGGSVRLNQIVDSIFDSPFVRVADLARRLNVSYPTAKADVERLVQAGILSELPQVTPKTYYSPAVFAVAYEKLEGV